MPHTAVKRGRSKSKSSIFSSRSNFVGSECALNANEKSAVWLSLVGKKAGVTFDWSVSLRGSLV